MISVLVILNLWSWTIWTLSSKHQDQAHHNALLVFFQHSYMQLWILSLRPLQSVIQEDPAERRKVKNNFILRSN